MTKQIRLISQRIQCRHVIAMLILILIIGAIVSAICLDHSVAAFVARHRNQWSRSIWIEAIKLLGKTWVPIWLLFLGSWVSGRMRLPVTGLISLLLVMTMVLPLKALIGRPRPKQMITAQEQGISTENLKGHSFPSGDTASIFALATALSIEGIGYWWIAAAGTATIVGVLRVAVLAHYPSDVCIGAMLGILCGLWAYRLVQSKPWEQLPSSVGFHNFIKKSLIVLPIIMTLVEGTDILWLCLKTYCPVLILISALVWIRRRICSPSLF